MAKARYLVEAHALEGRSVAELAKAHGVHRSWIYKLLARYREGGYEALEPRSRAPRRSPNRTPEEVVRAVVSLREQLLSQGHDGGAETIAHHLATELDSVPSVSTIWRILRREGLVVPQPHKRPRSSLIRFEAEPPNEMWQADITHWRLAGGEDAEILNMSTTTRGCSWPRAPSPPPRPPTWSTSFAPRSTCTGHPRPRSATTGPCSPRRRAGARCSCSSRWSASGSPPRTCAPITPRPAARSSAYIRP